MWKPKFLSSICRRYKMAHHATWCLLPHPTFPLFHFNRGTNNILAWRNQTFHNKYTYTILCPCSCFFPHDFHRGSHAIRRLEVYEIMSCTQYTPLRGLSASPKVQPLSKEIQTKYKQQQIITCMHHTKSPRQKSSDRI